MGDSEHAHLLETSSSTGPTKGIKFLTDRRRRNSKTISEDGLFALKNMAVDWPVAMRMACLCEGRKLGQARRQIYLGSRQLGTSGPSAFPIHAKIRIQDA
ncbi:hypothetical protein BgiBS90_035094 [Biomphalaria glabrata]|nr:hypothetical protein BgiBS90_035094 [Biomphalaria glabrata]